MLAESGHISPKPHYPGQQNVSFSFTSTNAHGPARRAHQISHAGSAWVPTDQTQQCMAPTAQSHQSPRLPCPGLSPMINNIIHEKPSQTFPLLLSTSSRHTHMNGSGMPAQWPAVQQGDTLIHACELQSGTTRDSLELHSHVVQAGPAMHGGWASLGQKQAHTAT